MKGCFAGGFAGGYHTQDLLISGGLSINPSPLGPLGPLGEGGRRPGLRAKALRRASG
jgi:hypothetical protein